MQILAASGACRCLYLFNVILHVRASVQLRMMIPAMLLYTVKYAIQTTCNDTRTASD